MLLKKVLTKSFAATSTVFVGAILLMASTAYTGEQQQDLQKGAALLEAGVAVVDITPPVPYRIAGLFREQISTGVHDHLCAKALVLKQGDMRVALVFCDILGISPELSKQARLLAQEKTGIPFSNICIAATHSHTGPLYFGALRNHFHDKAVARDGFDRLEKLDYVTKLKENVAKAICDARSVYATGSHAGGNCHARRVVVQSPLLHEKRRPSCLQSGH